MKMNVLTHSIEMHKQLNAFTLTDIKEDKKKDSKSQKKKLWKLLSCYVYSNSQWAQPFL